jgi:hypothetical protein
MLRSKLDQETVEVKLAGDRTFKTNQQWVIPVPTVTQGETPKWSWFGVLFLLVPFGMLSDKKSFQLCGCVLARKDVTKCTTKKEESGS